MVDAESAGSPEAVRLKDRVLLDARALDDLRLARHHFENILRLWAAESGLHVRGAIYQAGVVTYSRPFVFGRRGSYPAYPIREFAGVANYDRAIHEHLLLLRHRFLAHSDREAYKSRVQVQSVTFRHISGETLNAVTGLMACAYGWDGIDDQEYVKAIFRHTEAMIATIANAAYTRVVNLLAMVASDRSCLPTPGDGVTIPMVSIDGRSVTMSPEAIANSVFKAPDEEIGGPEYQYHQTLVSAVIDPQAFHYPSGELAGSFVHIEPPNTPASELSGAHPVGDGER